MSNMFYQLNYKLLKNKPVSVSLEQIYLVKIIKSNLKIFFFFYYTQLDFPFPLFVFKPTRARIELALAALKTATLPIKLPHLRLGPGLNQHLCS
jgi:hypothetical protein